MQLSKHEITIMATALYKAMRQRGDAHDDAIEAIASMRSETAAGADPEELLHEEGFEPDYIFDIIT